VTTITSFSIYFSQDRSSALVIPVVSDLDIKCIVAPPISLTTSSKSQRWNKPIFGLSFEINLTTDVECFISKTQVNCTPTPHFKAHTPDANSLQIFLSKLHARQWRICSVKYCCPLLIFQLTINSTSLKRDALREQ
jgi:hypothetical protein